MKYLILVGSGLTDQPAAERDNKTPLQLSDTPNLDRAVEQGEVGSFRPIPDQFHPGSDVSFLSLLGFAPEKYYGGAASFVANELGIMLEEGEVPLCCDFIHLQSSHNDMVMKDFTASHLSNEDSHALLDALQEQIVDVPVRFHRGEGHHNIMVIKSPPFLEKLLPPHELIGEGIRQHMPAGEEFKELVYITNQAQIILHNHPHNRELQSNGKDPVNSIWLWGNGAAQALPGFYEQFGKQASLVSASLLLKGMARSAGMKVVSVAGATGFANTNYPGKVAAALKELNSADVVYLHVGAAEEFSLRGNLDDKVLAIEDFDSEIVGPLLNNIAGRKDVKMLIMGSHMSSVMQMKYSRDPVPFVVTPSSKRTVSLQHFSEQILESDTARFQNGPALIEALLRDQL